MDKTILECVNLCKGYTRPVLTNLNIKLPKGKIVGLLGVNGCGKSTLMKLICGLLVPDSGEIYVCGEKQSELTNAYVSYLPERTYLSSWMQVAGLIEYFADFYP
jgi:ABC-2 type transport system ATP-binding protein